MSYRIGEIPKERYEVTRNSLLDQIMDYRIVAEPTFHSLSEIKDRRVLERSSAYERIDKK